ncbi:MAG: enoyl-CoA hydratase/isomerase family protein [Chloroflexi bacterium]|nr:enoyl-CoA hydratase/isomerase family protein [Chloroflexota bacterium]
MTEAILRERRDGIEVVAINRPEVGNAIDLATIRRLLDVVAELERDDTLRAVVLTGSGDRAFVTGGDLRDFLSLQTQQAARHMALSMQDALARLELLDVPVICALNGHAFGGGCEVALACDLRVAAEHVQLGFRQVKMAIMVGWGGGQRLVQIVGRSRALELLQTGDVIDAHAALALGLVDHVVPRGEALPAAVALAERMAANPPLAVRHTKRALIQGRDMSARAAMAYEAELLAALWVTEDHREAERAFLEKREPRFTGR